MEQKIPTSAELIDRADEFWQSYCRGSSPPFRYDFSQFEENYFLLERDHKGVLRIRSGGLFFERLTGGSLSGRHFASLISQAQRQKLDVTLDAVFNSPAKTYLDLATKFGNVKLALYPVRADHGPIDYALGATDLCGFPEIVSPVFELQNCRIVSLREEKPQLRYGFAEERAGFQPQNGNAAFKLIQGDGDGGSKMQHQFKLIKHIKREP